MKTKKFIEGIKSMGFKIKKIKDYFVVIDANGFCVSEISEEYFGVFSTDYVGFYDLDYNTKLQLLNHLIKYAKTPIEDRGEEEKYFLKLRGIKGRRFLNAFSDYSKYFIEDQVQVSGDIITQFTQSEIDDMPECYTHPTRLGEN